jgi:GAF domain-containing protein
MGHSACVSLPEESVRELSLLAGVVLSSQDLPSTHTELTRIAARALPGADGASITTFSEGRPSASAASDEWAQQLDELQYAEREGPCLDAVRTGNVFRVRDLAGEGRWPFYAPRAAAHGAHGAHSMVSLPMSAEGKVIGALNVYSRSPDGLGAESVTIGEVIAAHCGLAAQVAAAFFGHRDLAQQLREAMSSRAVIEQAKGVVVGARRCSPDDAFAALRTTSQRRNVKLREVAQQVVDTCSADPLEQQRAVPPR